jgi:hypothetical protein
MCWDSSSTHQLSFGPHYSKDSPRWQIPARETKPWTCLRPVHKKFVKCRFRLHSLPDLSDTSSTIARWKFVLTVVALIMQDHLRRRGVKRRSWYVKQCFAVPLILSEISQVIHKEIQTSEFLNSNEQLSPQDLMQQTIIAPQTWVLRDWEYVTSILSYWMWQCNPNHIGLGWANIHVVEILISLENQLRTWKKNQLFEAAW